MEKYAKLMKGLEMCAGPDCCKDGCPYYGETRGGKTCRAWLLHDAAAAIANEEAGSDTLLELLHNTEAERDKMAAEVDHLEAEKNAYRTERDELDKGLTLVIQHRDELAADKNALREENKSLIEARDALVRKASDLKSKNDELRYECDMTVTRCQVLQNKINALVQKTDRASVSDDELKSEYKRGYLDAMEYCFRELCKRAGGGCCHE